METPTLLIEDDVASSKMLNRFLERNEYDVIGCYSLEEAEESLTPAVKMVFTDLRLSDGDGINFPKQVKGIFPDLPVVVMTSYAEVSTVIGAMKLGVSDYISEPFQQEGVLNVIKNAQNTVFSTPKPEAVEAAAPLSKTGHSSPAKMVKAPKVTEGNPFIKRINPASKKLSKFINLVVPTGVSVLIMDESGIGKEVVAKLIHLKSERRNKPFIAVGCGAIPEEIASSEFFGRVKDLFIEAITDKKGHLEEASGDTTFLDEMGNLSYEGRIQLLRALQERHTKSTGSSKEIEIDTRVLAVTNGDLLEAVNKDDFREDLYHRLNGFVIGVSSLGKHKGDLMIFASCFLEMTNEKLYENVQSFTEGAVQKMLNYSWGSNLHELSNAMKRATLLTTTDHISGNELPDFVMSGTRHFLTEHFSFSIKENERGLIIGVLHETNNDKAEAVKLLGFTRKTLYNKLKAYNIEEF